ncbi:MAG: response regulator [Syntrophobacteraceae bacterium]
MSEKPIILAIDDEETIRRSIRGFFEDSGFEVWEAGNGREGLELFRRKLPEVVLVDLRMPGISGLEVIEKMAAEAPEIPLVVLSGTGVIADAIDAIRKGAWDYVTKPVIDMAALEHVVNSARERAKLREESRRYREHLEEEVLRRTRQLRQLNYRLKTIVRSSRSVMACTSVAAVTRQLLAEFASNMCTEAGALYLLEEGKLVLMSALGPGRPAASIPLPVPTSSIIGKALVEKAPILVLDVAAEGLSLPDVREEWKQGALCAFPLIDSTGEPLGIVMLHNSTCFTFTEQDVEIGAVLASYSCEATRAVRAMELLNASETQYRNLVENINEVIYAVNADGIFTYVSPVSESMTGYRPEEIIGRNYREFSPSPRKQESTIQELLKGTARQAEFAITKKSGGLLWVRASSRPVQNGDRVTGIHGVLTDISERKAAEEQLEKRAFELTVINDLARELGFELTLESAVSTSLRHVMQSIEPDVALIFTMEEGNITLKGLIPEPLGSQDDALAIHRAAERICGLAVQERLPVFSRDISSEPRCAFEKCEQSGLRSFGALPLISAGEIIGVLGVASHHERDFQKDASFLETLSNEIAIGMKNNILYHKAQNYALELKAHLMQIEAAEKENRELTKQLNQAQKMEAVGTLAAGIAHDFNNILSAIVGYTEITRLKTDQAELKSHLDRVLGACDRAKNLVGRILTFSRATDLERRPVDIGSIITEALKLVRASIPSMIEIRQDITSNVLTVLADPTQIHQVLINLCTNAAHAMSQRDGVIEVGLENLEVTPQMAHFQLNLSPGLYVKLTVRDTGDGIAPELMHRIFEPFFTTKTKGESTGLGLSVVYGIAKGCGGTVTAESELGEGSVFSVYLPAITDTVVSTPIVRDPLPEGSERILFVDDEEIIVDICREMLESLGYTVTASVGGMAALEIFRRSPDKFDLVITDMTMPGITGVDLSREILTIRPDIPIILCTGFTELITEEKAKAMGIREFVMKPLSRRAIAELARKALEQKHCSHPAPQEWRPLGSLH